MKINYKGIKAKEIVWVTHSDIDHNPLYCITSDEYRECYYLYAYNNKENLWVKTKYKSTDPTELSKRFGNISKEEIVSAEPEIVETKKRGRPPKSKLF